MKVMIGIVISLLLVLTAGPAPAQDCVAYDTSFRILSVAPMDLLSRNVVVQGDLAYVVGGYFPLLLKNFQVFDISDVRHPEVLGSALFGGGATFLGLDVHGTTAFTVSGGYFLAIDVSDPAAPVAAGSASVSHSMREVRVTGDGNHVLAAGTDALVVLDVSDPTTPTVVTSLALPGGARDIELWGTVAYLVGTDTFNIVDVANPAAPVLLGSQALGSVGFSIAAGDGVVFIGAWEPDYGIYSFDVSDPGLPVARDYYEVGYPRDLSLDSASGRLAVAFNGTLNVLDVNDPAAMTLVARPGVGGQSVDVADGRAWLAQSTTGIYLAGFELGGTGIVVPEPALPAPAAEIAVAGDRAYALVREFGLWHVDVLDFPGGAPSPTRLGRLIIGSESDMTYDLVVAGNLVAAAIGTRVELVDVSDPAAPAAAGTITRGDLVRGVALGNGVLYVSDTTGVWTYDVTDPASPAPLGSLSVPYFARRIAVAGDVLFVADEEWGLRVVDVSDPALPVTRSLLDAGVSAIDLAVAGSHVYLGDHFKLATVDVADLDNPQLVDLSGLPGYLDAMDASEDHLAVAAGSTMLLYDLSDPAAPAIMGSGESGSSAFHGIALSGGRVLADGMQLGIRVFAAPCGAPAAVGESPVPAPFTDLRTYPNPFNPSASIAFALDSPTRVTLRVYGADGRFVAELLAGHLPAGDHVYRWDGRDAQGRRAASGLYFARLQSPSGASTGRMMMVK